MEKEKSKDIQKNHRLFKFFKRLIIILLLFYLGNPPKCVHQNKITNELSNNANELFDNLNINFRIDPNSDITQISKSVLGKRKLNYNNYYLYSTTTINDVTISVGILGMVLTYDERFYKIIL